MELGATLLGDRCFACGRDALATPACSAEDASRFFEESSLLLSSIWAFLLSALFLTRVSNISAASASLVFGGHDSSTNEIQKERIPNETLVKYY